MNYVISAASGYDCAALTPFLASAQRHLKSFKMILLIQKQDFTVLKPLLSRFPFVSFEYIERGDLRQMIACWLKYVLFRRSKTYQQKDRHGLSLETRQEIEVGMNPCLTRFFFIEKLLQNLDLQPDSRIMLADSRDIIFQGDAFGLLSEPFVTGYEPVTVGKKDQWIGRVYGEEGQKALHRRQVICAGFSIGGAAEVRRYVGVLCDELWARLFKILFHRGPDQAVHIRLFHDGRLPARICHNHEGLIATISMEGTNNLEIDRAGGVVKVYGKIPVVLHQYDRFADIAQFVQELYP